MSVRVIAIKYKPIIFPANLALKKEVTFSSLLHQKDTENTLLVTDRKLSTCERTAIEDNPVISISLDDVQIVADIAIRTDFLTGI